jgi:hypothetical protein
MTEGLASDVLLATVRVGSRNRTDETHNLRGFNLASAFFDV